MHPSSLVIPLVLGPLAVAGPGRRAPALLHVTRRDLVVGHRHGEDRLGDPLHSDVAPWRAGPRRKSEEIEMEADSEVLDPIAVKLPVGGVAVEVLDHELELPVKEGQLFELNAGPQREVGRPVVLLAVLEIEGGERPEPASEEGPGAPDLDPVLRGPGRQLARLAAEAIPAAAVDPERLAELVGELDVHGFVTQIDSVDAVAQEELVAEVGTLVEHADHRREVAQAVGDGYGDYVVRVDKVARGPVEIEDAENPHLKAELPRSRA